MPQAWEHDDDQILSHFLYNMPINAAGRTSRLHIL